MKLLDLNIIKRKSNENEQEIVLRLKKLRDAEKDLIEKVTILKGEYDHQKEINNTQIPELKLQTDVKKQILLSEITELENQKRELLKPIKEIKKDADELFEDNKKQQEILNQKIKETNDAKDALANTQDQIDEIFDDIQDKRAVIDARLKGIEGAEDEIRKSSKILSNEWVQYYRDVAQKTKELDERENKLSDLEKVLLILQKENEDEKIRLSNLDKAIKDKYVAFEQSQKHASKTR
jgi:uncharacterized coiled-coil DUF342 family protein